MSVSFAAAGWRNNILGQSAAQDVAGGFLRPPLGWLAPLPSPLLEGGRATSRSAAGGHVARLDAELGAERANSPEPAARPEPKGK